MQVESIEIRNYRLFRDTKLLRIPRLCVPVCANGTGKSTLFAVFSFRGFEREPIEITLQHP
jgi:predicted ATPase